MLLVLQQHSSGSPLKAPAKKTLEAPEGEVAGAGMAGGWEVGGSPGYAALQLLQKCSQRALASAAGLPRQGALLSEEGSQKHTLLAAPEGPRGLFLGLWSKDTAFGCCPKSALACP